jgi:cytochrome c-type biogenesis protein CcmH/NrfG
MSKDQSGNNTTTSTPFVVRAAKGLACRSVEHVLPSLGLQRVAACTSVTLISESTTIPVPLDQRAGTYMRRTTRPRLLVIWLIFGAASIGPGWVTAATLVRDNDRAIADYNEAIRIDPDYADAFYGRGNAWSEKFDDARALADYNQAIRLDPNHAAALNNRGAAWLAMGQYDRAVADFSAAIRIDPRDADYYNNLGNAWHLKGDNDRAIVDYDEAIRLNPRDPCPLYNRGSAWQAKGDLDRALADYDEAIRVAPNYRCWGVKRKTIAPVLGLRGAP